MLDEYDQIAVAFCNTEINAGNLQAGRTPELATNLAALLRRTTDEAVRRQMALSSANTSHAARPTIVCLCGSTQFGEAFAKARLDETVAGRIVLTIGCDVKGDRDLFAHLSPDERAALKHDLDELHLHKIAMADEILILNVSGYVGDSTRREIAHALRLGKRLRWLEPDKALNRAIVHAPLA